MISVSLLFILIGPLTDCHTSTCFSTCNSPYEWIINRALQILGKGSRVCGCMQTCYYKLHHWVVINVSILTLRSFIACKSGQNVWRLRQVGLYDFWTSILAVLTCWFEGGWMNEVKFGQQHFLQTCMNFKLRVYYISQLTVVGSPVFPLLYYECTVLLH